MIDLIKRAWRREDGVAMVWFATTIVFLLGTAGFAIDLGWMYLNASRTQRTVDAAAMAGVVHLPGFPQSADSDARSTARANGYDVCDPGNTGCADTLVATPIAESQLEVEISTTIPSFFLAVLGFDSFDVTRSAVAEYVKPVPMGSPNRCFGQDPTGTYCAPDPGGFWAAVSAPYTKKENGDPYSTKCLEPTSAAAGCASDNAEYSRGGSYNGYYFAVEVEPGTTDLTIMLYDAGFYDRNVSVETGDSTYSPGTNDPWAELRYQFYYPDSTPQDPTDNPGVPSCDLTMNPGAWESTYKNQWVTLCSVSGSITPGIWVLHVKTQGTGAGSNSYSVAAYTGAGPQPRVYGLNDMSIWNNQVDDDTDLYLVEVDPIHAGAKLELQFFDPGDAQGNSWMSVLDPFDDVPNCTWNSQDYTGTVIESGSGSCSWQTTDTSLPDKRRFNNQWITAVIDIPDSYTCNGSDCFWKMNLDLASANERTVWRARVIGNPVRLVP
jgi:hypothetical protein